MWSCILKRSLDFRFHYKYQKTGYMIHLKGRATDYDTLNIRGRKNMAANLHLAPPDGYNTAPSTGWSLPTCPNIGHDLDYQREANGYDLISYRFAMRKEAQLGYVIGKVPLTGCDGLAHATQ